MKENESILIEVYLAFKLHNAVCVWYNYNDRVRIKSINCESAQRNAIVTKSNEENYYSKSNVHVERLTEA